MISHRLKSKNFSLTCNNPDVTLEVFANNLKGKQAIWGVVQLEVGANGTPHFQAGVGYANERHIKAVIKQFPGCHVEVARNAWNLWQYCQKKDSRAEGSEPITFGAAPAARKNVAGDTAARNKALLEIGAENAVQDGLIPLRDYQRVKSAIDLYNNCTKSISQLTELDNHWIYGPPGSGKTSHVLSLGGRIYEKDKSKYWNGYTDQEIVLIDDIEKDETFMLGHLKKWCQHKAFQAEDKFGQMRLIRPKSIYVTSNFRISEIWESEVDRQALGRRFNVVHKPAMFMN